MERKGQRPGCLSKEESKAVLNKTGAGLWIVKGEYQKDRPVDGNLIAWGCGNIKLGTTLGAISMSMVLLLAGCGASQAEKADISEVRHDIQTDGTGESEQREEKAITMKLKIDNTVVPVKWEESASTKALKEILPLTISMSRYGDFEQVGSIGRSIYRDDNQTTTNFGDIVLYSGDKIVIFYGSNTWSYTRLGHIELSEEEMAELLSHSDVTITISEE